MFLTLIFNSDYDINYFPSASIITILHEYIPGLYRPQWLSFIHEGKPFKLETEKSTFSGFYLGSISDNTGKIFNPYLERSFQLKQYQTGLPSIEVFHGTVPENVKSIAENNFNWRLTGRSRGWKHGKGVCFSRNESFARQFCRGQEKTIIKAKILHRFASVGGQAQLLPPNGYDSTRSPNGNVIVKFEDSEFLPISVSPYNDTFDDFVNLFKNLGLNN